MKFDKYALYQAAVQDPNEDIEIYASMYRSLKATEPRVLREDFCGTFAFSCAWVKAAADRRALALDLDKEPLEYGRARNLSKLTADEKRRLRVMRKNVMSVTSPKADLIVANNFSFLIFKEREQLTQYFSAARRSLSSKGILVLELAGGAEMMKKGKEQRVVVTEKGERFTYQWEQKFFNPVSHHGIYAINFTFEDGTRAKEAFLYDWRLWTIAEVRECMRESGFKKTHVFWERYVLGEPSGQYIRGEVMPNDDFWLAYVVAER